MPSFAQLKSSLQSTILRALSANIPQGEESLSPYLEDKGLSITRSPLPQDMSIPPSFDNGLINTALTVMNGRNWTLAIPNTKFDYQRAVGDPILNSAVAACLNWVMRTFPEAPLQVEKRDEHGVYHSDQEHDMLKLVEKPNPFYDDTILWMGTLVSYSLSGNAYWLKKRNNAGKVIELYYVPHVCIEPRWPEDNSTYLSHYEFNPGDGRIYKIAPEDLVHFRYGMDNRNDRKGLSPLAALFREIYTDNEATNFSSSLLRNMGIPGIIISPASDDTVIDPEQAQSIKDNFKKKFGGDNRGDPMVMSAGIKVTPVALNPQQLDLKMLHRLPEERISAVMGIPAIVAGLGAGLDRSTMANFKEAREMAYESNIIPTQRVLSKQLKAQLLVEFEKETTKYRVSFDLSQVRVLQDDENTRWQRIDIGVRGGWIKRSEARALINLPVNPADEYYLSGGNGGIDEYGQPVPGLGAPDAMDSGLMPNVALQNAQEIRQAGGIRRNAGSATLSRADQASRGMQPGRGQARGYHGRFIDVGNDSTDTSTSNDTKPESSGKKKTDDSLGLEYKGEPIGVTREDIASLVEVSEAELEVAKQMWRQNAPEGFEGLLDGQGTPSDPLRMRDALEAVIDASSLELSFSSQKLLYHLQQSGDADSHSKYLAKWYVAMQLWIKAAHLVVAAAALGGWDKLDDAALAKVKENLTEEYRMLTKLADHLASGELPFNERLVRFSSSRSKSAWATYHELASQGDHI